MTGSKLMIPLFYEHSFNREGHKMRAVFEREISNGTETYRLWRSAGKPDRDYPSAENDKYILYAECNGYLVPLGMTDFYLVNHCGFKIAVQKLYGSSEERERHFDDLRKSGSDSAVLAALDAEKVETEQSGNDPVVQANYIQGVFTRWVNIYLEAKENGGKTFPDFHGAAILDDLPRCVELAAIYRAAQREKEQAHAAQQAAEERAFCEERNKEAEQAVSAAIQIILAGGVLKNETVTFYRGRYSYSSYSLVNYLMRQYKVDVPLRTQGWINDKLSSATIENGKCEHLKYYRSKNGQCSQKFFSCMNALIRAVTEQTLKEAKDNAA